MLISCASGKGGKMESRENAGLMPTFKTMAAQESFLAAYDRELASWKLPTEEIDLPTDYGRTHAIVFGNPSGEPLVLFHWFSSNSNVWKDMAPLLAADFRVYAVDVIGDMGKSIATDPPKDEAGIASWASQALDGLGLDRPLVGGLSNGGYTAAVFAREKPERVKKLILMSPAATLRPFKFAFFASVISTALNPSDRAIARFKRDWSYRHDAWSDDFASMIAMAFRVGKIQVKVYPRSFKDEELKALSMPVLALIGDKESIYSPKEAASRAERLIPDAKVVILKDCDHAMPIDAPDPAAAAIIDFAGQRREGP
jgi:pimeloyl-ACP methyl ester carboxylesterase